MTDGSLVRRAHAATESVAAEAIGDFQGRSVERQSGLELES